MNERIILRAGEALVAGGPPNTASEPEVIIGELDGPVGTALATLTGDQVVGHSRVFALLNTDIMVRPVTLCVSKVSVTESKYTSILMGTVQFAIANGVLDAVRAGYIPKHKANDLGIICSVWLSPGVIEAQHVDHKALFDIQRRGMTEAIRKAMTAATYGRNTLIFKKELADSDRQLLEWGDLNVTTLQGGLVVKSGKQVVGGVGSGGGSLEQDEAMARVLVRAMGFEPEEERPRG